MDDNLIKSVGNTISQYNSMSATPDHMRDSMSLVSSQAKIRMLQSK